MTQDELKTIIRQVIADLLRPTTRRALVLFTGGMIGFEDAIASLRRLQASGVQLQCTQTPTARRILDQRLIASIGMQDVTKNLVTDHDMLVLPTLTGNIAAKVAHGVADCLTSNVTAEFIMSDRPVIASKAPVSPESPGKQHWYPNIPVGYAEMLQANLATLTSFGVRLAEPHALCRTAIAAFETREAHRRAPLVAALGTSAAELTSPSAARTVAIQPRLAGPSPATTGTATTSNNAIPCAEKLISQRIVQQLPQGSELRVARNAVVTALAQDTAAARAVRITREG